MQDKYISILRQCVSFYVFTSSAPEKTKKALSLTTNLYLLQFKFYRENWIKLSETKANCDIDLVEWKRSLSACKYLNGRHTYLIMFTFSAICVTKFSEELKFLQLLNRNDKNDKLDVLQDKFLRH